MKKYAILLIITMLLGSVILNAQKNNTFEVVSPDGNIKLKIEAGSLLQWSVMHKGEQIIEPSAISLLLMDGTTLGKDVIIKSSKKEEINTSFNAINYKKAVVTDQCNQLTLNCKDNYGVIFRVYDDAVAYRLTFQPEEAGLQG